MNSAVLLILAPWLAPTIIPRSKAVKSRCLPKSFEKNHFYCRAEHNHESLYTQCGDSLTESCGMLMSPEFPNNYPPNCRCTWEISTSPDTYVVIYFSSVNLEKHQSCYWDSVSILDGPPGSAMIGKICEQGTYTFYASSNIMTVVFKSDDSVEDKGFHAIYYTQTFLSKGTPTTVANPRCGGPMTRNWGSLTSPFYPSSYSPNTLCIWEISPQQYCNIYLSIVIESLESHPNCNYDYVEITGGNIGSNVHAKICQPGIYSYNIFSNRMNIVFKSDRSIESNGFEAQFFTYHEREPYTNCGGTLTESSGEITSPFYPENYPTNCWCVWQIIAPSDNTVQINFTFVNIEYHQTCDYDYVAVYDGEQQIANFCGSQTGLYHGSSNSMRIEFKSDSSIESCGFRASYNYVDLNNVPEPYTNCGGTLTESSGEITSPFYPENYPTNCWCVWQIIAPSDNTVEVIFTFVDIEYHQTCDYDYVAVYDGEHQIANFCGSQTGLYHGSSNSMRIEFKSDSSIESCGFRASYNYVVPVTED